MQNHAKTTFPAGNMLYPVPPVLVSVRGADGSINVLTVAWAGTVCSDPAMLSISVRPSRHSYEMLRQSGEFVVNLVTEEMVPAADFCGVRSGAQIDKFEAAGLTPSASEKVAAPGIAESPVNIECRVRQVIPLGSHDLFLADVAAVRVDSDLLDAEGKLHLERAKLVAYSHGMYYALGRELGSFGFSVRKSAPQAAGLMKRAEEEQKEAGQEEREAADRAEGKGKDRPYRQLPKKVDKYGNAVEKRPYRGKPGQGKRSNHGGSSRNAGTGRGYGGEKRSVHGSSSRNAGADRKYAGGNRSAREGSARNAGTGRGYDAGKRSARGGAPAGKRSSAGGRTHAGNSRGRQS